MRINPISKNRKTLKKKVYYLNFIMCFKQLRKLTKYKTGSLIPEKVRKKKSVVIEDLDFAQEIMTHI